MTWKSGTPLQIQSNVNVHLTKLDHRDRGSDVFSLEGGVVGGGGAECLF